MLFYNVNSALNKKNNDIPNVLKKHTLVTDDASGHIHFADDATVEDFEFDHTFILQMDAGVTIQLHHSFVT